MKLFYREWGRGEPLLILHGLYGCSDNWMTIAQKLAERFYVFAVDLRNHGNSPHADSHTYTDMSLDLEELFLLLQINSAHIIGHSMGGKVAMAFAADFPERIRSLTVVDIAPKNYLLYPNGTSQYEKHKQILDTFACIDLSNFSSRVEVEEVMKSRINDTFLALYLLKNLKRLPAGFSWKINVPVLQNYLLSIVSDVNADFFESRLPIFNYPVLFVKGALSEYISSADEFDIKRIYPEVRFCSINGATHYLHAEKPDEFIAAFLDFI